MTKYQKILTALVIALVAINAVLIGFIWTQRPSARELPGRRERMPEIKGRMLMKQLNFSDEQARDFKKSLRTHHRAMDVFHQSLRRHKNKITQAIIRSDSSAVREGNQRLLEIQKEMELESQAFTAYLAGLCTEQQRQELLRIYDQALEWRSEKPDRHE